MMRPMDQQPSTPRTPGRPKTAIALVSVIAAFSIMACSLFSKPASLSDKANALVTAEVGKIASTIQASDQTGGETPTPEVTAHVVELQSTLPRDFKYNNLTFSLQKAVFSNFPPDGMASEPNHIYAMTIWKVTNPTTESVSVKQGVFTLQLADGSKATAAYEDYFNSQESRIVKINFSVPASATWDKAAVAFTEPDKEPATLPLNGDVPKSPYPKTLKASGQAQVNTPKLIYEIQGASVDLDGMGQRAGQGKQFVLFKVQATCKDKYDCYVGPESFRILVDGTPISAQKVDPVAEAVKVDNSQVFRLAFEVPDDAKQVFLQVGEAGKDTAKIPVDLGAAK